MASLSLPALSATALFSLLVSSPPAFAHGELVRSISEVTAHLEAELRRPVDGHHRAKLYLERGELYRLNRDFTRAAQDYDAAEKHEPPSGRPSTSPALACCSNRAAASPRAR